eukprot:gene4434-14569_t
MHTLASLLLYYHAYSLDSGSEREERRVCSTCFEVEAEAGQAKESLEEVGYHLIFGLEFKFEVGLKIGHKAPRHPAGQGVAAGDEPVFSAQGRLDPHGQYAIPPAGRTAPGSMSLKEVILLNSLKYLMGVVPGMENEIQHWCGGGIPRLNEHSAAPGTRHDSAFDGMAPQIGAQFAQVVKELRSLAAFAAITLRIVVKELRSEYALAVAAIASRIVEQLKSKQHCNLKVALAQYKPPFDGGGCSTQQLQDNMSSSLLSPLLCNLEDACRSLQAVLEPRVYVAICRALWDYMGRELFQFVEHLQEGYGDGTQAAWRARQSALLALGCVNDFFHHTLPIALTNEGSSLHPKDLDHPAHIERVLRLLDNNSASMSESYSPF